ncbi:MAG TPA: small ribosomal subunit Rsm22 family protein [Myxococcota bacterium]
MNRLDPTAIATRVALVAEACIAVARGQHASSLGADVQRLSGLFTDQRGNRSSTYMREPAMRRAYLAFFVPHNVARLSSLLLQAHQEGLLPGIEPRSVLDLGAGPLSGVLATWCVYGALPAATAVDLSRSALDAGVAVLQKVGADVANVVTLERSIGGAPGSWLPKQPVDLVIAANVLNELSDPRDHGPRNRLVSAALSALSARGRFLIVEPAMRVETRALMALRDDLVADGVGILSPCRGARACPLLQTRGDWCHQELRWDQRPAAYVALEREARLPKGLLAAAHLLLGTPTDPAPQAGLRVVGGVMRDPQGVERRYVCGRELVTISGTPRLPKTVGDAHRGGLVGDAEARVGAADTRTAARAGAPPASRTDERRGPPTRRSPHAPPSRNGRAGPARGPRPAGPPKRGR